VRIFPDKESDASEEIFPKAEGIDPVKQLSLKDSASIFFRLPNAVGMVPFKLF
jgi:hypothetical protein